MSIFIVYNDYFPFDPKGIKECHDTVAVNDWLSQRSKDLFNNGKKFNIENYTVIEGKLLNIEVSEVFTKLSLEFDKGI